MPANAGNNQASRLSHSAVSLKSGHAAAAWLQASAINGALTMAAFGLGTLPLMLPLTWTGARLGQRLQQGRWRIAAASLVLAAGVATLASPWLVRHPGVHAVLAALGCLPATL